jgi:hypothetical protein
MKLVLRSYRIAWDYWSEDTKNDRKIINSINSILLSFSILLNKIPLSILIKKKIFFIYELSTFSFRRLPLSYFFFRHVHFRSFYYFHFPFRYFPIFSSTFSFSTFSTKPLNCIGVEELHFHTLSNHDDSDDYSINAHSKDFHLHFSLLKL